MLTIKGSGGVSVFFPRTITFMDRIRDKVNLEELISHKYTFEKIQDAFREATKNKVNALKVMLNF